MLVCFLGATASGWFLDDTLRPGKPSSNMTLPKEEAEPPRKETAPQQSRGEAATRWWWERLTYSEVEEEDEEEEVPEATDANDTTYPKAEWWFAGSIFGAGFTGHTGSTGWAG